MNGEGDWHLGQAEKRRGPHQGASSLKLEQHCQLVNTPGTLKFTICSFRVLYMERSVFKPRRHVLMAESLHTTKPYGGSPVIIHTSDLHPHNVGIWRN